MIVLSLSVVPAKLRGYLNIYLLEIDTNVYVGNVSARVRDLIWKRVEENVDGRGRAIMVFPSVSEQGFDFRVCGASYKPVDFEGLKLIFRPTAKIMDAMVTPKIIRSVPAGLKYDRYTVVDLETTGLNVEKDRIIEIGALKIENNVVKKTLQKIIKTDVQIPENIIGITGITQETCDNGSDFTETVSELKDFVANTPVIGYNIAAFDARIMRSECIRNKAPYPFMRVVDVLPIAKSMIQRLSSYTMKGVAEALDIKQENTHRAISDCIVCNEIYQKLKEVSPF